MPEARSFDAVGLPIRLEDAPDDPGVYLFRDERGEVLYVGKAASLRQRLASYRPGDLEARKLPLLSKTAKVDLLITRSEKEALLLESGLVKRHRPPYNVRLADDKRYPYLRITADPWPRVMIVRDVRGRGHHFGPFPDATAARRTMQVIREAFKLRDCKELLPGGCLNFQLNLCLAPCVLDPAERVQKVGDVPLAHADVPLRYAEGTRDTLAFLRGDLDRVAKALTTEMRDAADREAYERAAAVRDQISAVRATLERQAVFSRDAEDRDAFVVATGDGSLAVGVVLLVRGGEVAGEEHFYFREAGGRGPADLLAEFVHRFYEHLPTVPGEIVVPEEIPGKEALGLVLSEKRGGPVAFVVPQRGDRTRLLEVARRNADFRLRQETLRRGEHDAAREMEELRVGLGLPSTPRRIECFDVSHLAGTGVVASMAVVVDGRPRPAEYRRFKVRTDANDDVAAMREVLGRRVARIAEGADAAPDLLVVDGGRTQLDAALDALRAGGASGLRVAALSKHRGRERGGPDEVWLPGRLRPVEVPERGLRLLMRARDEAHRFAVQYQRKRREMKFTESGLDALPGVGAARKRALLAAFGSPEAVRRAPEDELARVPGVGRAVARRIRAYFDGEASR